MNDWEIRASTHEAGHAVIAHVLGVRVRSVSIGRHNEAVIGDATPEEDGIIMLAGTVAERKVTRLRDAHEAFGNAYGDLAELSALANAYADGSAALATDFTNECGSAARKLVKALWPVILDVAAVLRKRRALSEAEFKQVMRWALNTRPGKAAPKPRTAAPTCYSVTFRPKQRPARAAAAYHKALEAPRFSKVLANGIWTKSA